MTEPTAKLVDIRCTCGTLFGYADASGERIAIKHRDLFRIIRGAVEGPCRRCGTVVKWAPTLESDDDDPAA